MKVHIQASRLNIALPENVQEKLRGKSAPIYVIAEEGKSAPRIIGEGNATLIWPSEAVKKVAAMARGVKLFVRHNRDNSHEGRKVIGRTVHTFVENKDKTKAIAVMDMYEDSKELDVCSIEADVQVDGNIVKDVNAISGIALSSSHIDSPAFPGARRLALLQCFGEQQASEQEQNKQGSKEIKPMTFQEVKLFLEEHNVYPRQLFTLEKLKEDREFGPIILAGEQAQKELRELQDKHAKLEAESKTAMRAVEELKAKELFAKLIPENATEKQKAFYLGRFQPSKLEKLDEQSLKVYLDAEAKEYAELAKMFGSTNQQEQEPVVKETSQTKTANNPVAEALSEVFGG